MSSEDVKNYIKQQLEAGASREIIGKSLEDNGWTREDIQNAFVFFDAPEKSEELQSGVEENAQPAKKKSKIWKIFKIIFGSIVGLIILFFFLPNIFDIFTNDIGPIDDSDLRLSKIELPPENQNAYFDMIKQGADVPWRESGILLTDCVEGEGWDEDYALDLLSRNKQTLVSFAEAAKKPMYQYPPTADPENINMFLVIPSLNGWRTMSQINALQALSLSKQGKHKEACGEALISVEIGQKMQESQLGTLIEYLVALAVKKTGLETLQKVVSESELSSEELKKYISKLDKYYKNEEGLINSFKAEYHSLAHIIDLITDDNNKGAGDILGGGWYLDIKSTSRDNFYFRPNKTKSYYAEHMRKRIKEVSVSCEQKKTIEDEKKGPSSLIKIYFTENVIGKMLHDITTVGGNPIINKVCEEDTLIASTQLIIALKAYSVDNDKLPQTLDQLVPEYISEIPTDPYSGESLKYSPSKKIIYSIGDDGEDNGGNTEKDIVYEITF